MSSNEGNARPLDGSAYPLSIISDGTYSRSDDDDDVIVYSPGGPDFHNCSESQCVQTERRHDEQMHPNLNNKPEEHPQLWGKPSADRHYLHPLGYLRTGNTKEDVESNWESGSSSSEEFPSRCSDTYLADGEKSPQEAREHPFRGESGSLGEDNLLSRVETIRESTSSSAKAKDPVSSVEIKPEGPRS